MALFSSLRSVVFWMIIWSSAAHQMSVEREGRCSCFSQSNQTECGCASSCVHQGDCCGDYRDNGTTILNKPKCKELAQTDGRDDDQLCAFDECVTNITKQVLFCGRAIKMRIRKIQISESLFTVDVRNPQNDSFVPFLFYISESGCILEECPTQILFNIHLVDELIAARLVGHNTNQSCHPDTTSCFWSLVYYNYNEFFVNWSSGGIEQDTIRHRRGGFILGASYFLISEEIGHEGDLATCLHNVSSFAPIARYLQLIFGGLSLMSIGVVVWLHWKFRKLQNLYGFCLLSLVGALAVINIIPFLQEVTFLASVVFTPIKHYAWLAVFAWESAIILHVHRRLGGNNIVHPMSGPMNLSLKNVAVQYAIFSWWTPIPFVLAGIICHSARIDNFQYGIHWFDDHNISTYVFFIPSFSFVIVGLALFIATLTNMGRVQSQTEETGGTPVDFLSIALRLQLTLGIPWIGFIILKFFPDPALLPVLVTVNSLQGFFIMVAFTTTKRVKTLLKDNYSTHPITLTT